MQKVAQRQGETVTGMFLAFRKSFSVVKITALNENDQISAFGETCAEVNKLQVKYQHFTNMCPEELNSFLKCRMFLIHSKLYFLTHGIMFQCS